MVTILSSDYMSFNLSSGRSFFEEEDYLEKTDVEMKAINPPMPPVYSCSVDKKKKKNHLTSLPSTAFKKVFMAPIVPAQYPSLVGYSLGTDRLSLIPFDFSEKEAYKRVAISVDGISLDVLLRVGKKHFINGRWMIFSTGNGEFAEQYAAEPFMKQISRRLKVNLLFYDHPGVGASTGSACKHSFIKAHLAVTDFLVQSLKATTIIDWGHSIGAACQTDDYLFPPNVEYIKIKSRTFTSLADVITGYIGARWMVRKTLELVDADFQCLKTSVLTKHPECILQSGNFLKPKELGDDISWKHCFPKRDPIIQKKNTLAYGLKKSKIPVCSKKLFYLIPEKHNEGFPSASLVTAIVEQMLLSLQRQKEEAIDLSLSPREE